MRVVDRCNLLPGAVFALSVYDVILPCLGLLGKEMGIIMIYHLRISTG